MGFDVNVAKLALKEGNVGDNRLVFGLSESAGELLGVFQCHLNSVSRLEGLKRGLTGGELGSLKPECSRGAVQDAKSVEAILI